jgi:hypothetical protein
MARTTDELVEGIIDVDSGDDLTPFINAANSLVTQSCTELDTDYTDAHLIIIETWLSAHFYTIKNMIAERERAGSVEAKYQSKVDLGFSTSHYGQMAMALDFYGGLSALNEKIKKGGGKSPGITWLGKTEEEVEADS